jgi:histone acetyltransferase (RNA polymerase elongator complex component)
MTTGPQTRGEGGCFIVPVFLPHEGCPHRCVFCNQHALAGASHDQPPGMDWRAAASDFLCFRGTARFRSEIAFYGGTFLGLPEQRLRELLAGAAAFVRQERLDGIRFSTRPDSVTAATLTTIADYPVLTVELGAQSMSDIVLRESGRDHTAEQTGNAVTLLRERGYRVGLQIMVGLPGEDPDISAETGRRIAALAPDFVRIYPTLVLAGSELERRFHEGRYQPLSLDQAVARTAGLYRFFRARRIPVIRTGLQATRDLAPGGAVVAGPHHPAFGQLVQSACFRQALLVALRQTPIAGRAVTMRVHPRSLARLRGHRNETIARLKAEFGWQCVEVKPHDSLPEDAILLPGGRLIRVYEEASGAEALDGQPGGTAGVTGPS